METAFINGKFSPREEIRISPDDRGFLFADGIYEVIRWYKGFFFDIEGHKLRLIRSLRELKIKSNFPDIFESTAKELIDRNNLADENAMIYFQITRGAARRTHHFPVNEIPPTEYAYAWKFRPDTESVENGIKVILRNDIRWQRCDIKSVSLLPNTLCFQEAKENSAKECIFNRNGTITEGSHSNIFFVKDGTLLTHPESDHILSGITRKNILRIARGNGIAVREEAVTAAGLPEISEAFISNTSSEVTPVIMIENNKVGDGTPGQLTRSIHKLFEEELSKLMAQHIS